MNIATSEELIHLLEKTNLQESQIIEDEFTSLLNKLTEAGHVPKREAPEDVPYDESEFVGTAKEAEDNLCGVLRLLESICKAKEKGQKFTPQFIRNIVVSVVIVAGQYREPKWPWSSEPTAMISIEVEKKLCNLCNCDNLSQLLTGKASHNVKDDNDLPLQPQDGACTKESGDLDFMKLILQRLSEIFTKKTWKLYPAIKMIYFDLLKLLDHTNLGELLAYLLPPALFITDDWEPRNKVLGLSALQYTLINTPGSELRWYGRAAVIFDAIKPLLYSSEAEVLEILYPTILEAAKVLEADPASTGKHKSETCFDVILGQLLRQMNGEQKLALRSIYSHALSQVIVAMGLLSLRWSKDLLEVFRDYLTTYDGVKAPDRINTLKSVKMYIQECWPQIHINVEDIMKMLVCLLYDITEDDANVDPEVTENIILEVETIVQLLASASPQTLKKVCRGISTVPVHSKCQCILERIENVTSVDVT